VDLDQHTLDDARAAAGLARQLSAEAPIVLVHVLAPIQAPPWLRLRRDHDATRVEVSEPELARVAQALEAAHGIEVRVLVGNPAAAIAVFAKRHVRLVVLTLRRGRGRLGSRPGTITYELSSMATTPVLAIPPTSSIAGTRPEGNSRSVAAATSGRSPSKVVRVA
jgi:nucleotide-binding universal stress UspA family protein